MPQKFPTKKPTDKIAHRNPCDAIRDEDSDLIRTLAAAAPSKILVSSRLTPRVLLNPSGQTINGAKRTSLPGLRPADAEQLLRSCGVTGDSTAMQNYLTTNCDNHPLVIGILAGLINDYLANRGNFDAWAIDPDGGAKLDLSRMDLIQRRNHILRAALDALPPHSHQLLSTLALLSESVDYETLKAFSPHPSSKPEMLTETVRDLEQRGLLQYDGHTRRHDINPVVRSVVAGGIQKEDKERYGQRVVDYFSSSFRTVRERPATLYIRQLIIENIRCFNRLELNFYTKKQVRSLTMLLGDNAVGKTTVLRCLVLALCDETSASSLMDNLDGNLLRHGCNEGKITVICGDRDIDGRDWCLRTRITRERGDVLALEQESPIDFPLKRIFACAYGAFRGGFGTKSYERYEVHDSVRSLFDYSASLQNPELVMRRMEAGGYDVAGLFDKMNEMLMLGDNATQIDSNGISISGPWQGRVSVGAIGDGYAATLAWLVDFFGRALFYNEQFLDSHFYGIVILDEIEKHLHPRWQRHIIRQLREQFPFVQFIVTSHSPICAGGVADLDEEDGAIYVLSHDHVAPIQIETPAGWRYDQVLTSSAFGLPSSRDAKTESIIDRLHLSYDRLHEHGGSEELKDEFQRILSELESRSVTAAQDESDRLNRHQLAEELRALKSLVREAK